MSHRHFRPNRLLEIANSAMLSHGLEPEFPNGVFWELDSISRQPPEEPKDTIDLTHLPWCSIDNDDSMDLDQITVTEPHPSGGTKILIGVADVDSLVKMAGAIDAHAEKNTTSVYTGVRLYPMLPEILSTNLTSLAEGKIRLAIVIEIHADDGGEIRDGKVYRALVINKSKLAYNSVAAWLEGSAPLPAAAEKVPGMDHQLRAQDRLAQKMRKMRHKQGALELESIEPRAVMSGGMVVDLKHELKNRAHELIEDFMIAANGVTARFLTRAHYPALRRVVRTPKRWARIVQVASELGEELPSQPDPLALSEFLSRRRKVDPLRFPDLSLVIIKLLGRGEYVLEVPGEESVGHFGLAVRDYTHSTAPNRRFPDLITHRLLKAAMNSEKSPYGREELAFLANHCTEQENASDKVERQVRKSAAALLLLPKVSEYFEGLVTGASEKGTWARIFHPPVEGKIVHGEHGLDVGDRVRLKLISVDVERGFIDFVRLRH